ncbi:radical SAM protein [Butyrivibrio proteoclasticus]|uniref:radical SAM protein n=1 Tax=Butyrivibrio proteoclasticus TaxID=43305 RepID=UPI002E8E0F51|nr:radical SAM protein [Butyrivibrio proteoclasticus]
MDMSTERYREYEACKLCPRKCGVNRYETKGYCNEGAALHVSRAALHMWEEPCISGANGSGTVFFSGCNMGCVFCQNRMISRGEIGKVISTDRLVEIFWEQKERGANNINLVTGDMFIPTIVTAIEKAKSDGFDLPFLLNTSSYLEVDSVKMLDGLVDIYLPDFKYIRDEDAVKYSNARGYVEAAKAAIDEMVRQCPVTEFVVEKNDSGSVNRNAEGESTSDYSDENKIMAKGVVVRHLLMPGMLIQAKMIVKYLYERYGDKIYISLMNQFTPNGELAQFPEINRKVTDRDYDSLVDYAANLGVTKGFMQVGETAKESFIPDFDMSGV